jgi:hypothetical protein
MSNVQPSARPKWNPAQSRCVLRAHSYRAAGDAGVTCSPNSVRARCSCERGRDSNDAPLEPAASAVGVDAEDEFDPCRKCNGRSRGNCADNRRDRCSREASLRRAVQFISFQSTRSVVSAAASSSYASSGRAPRSTSFSLQSSSFVAIPLHSDKTTSISPTISEYATCA